MDTLRQPPASAPSSPPRPPSPPPVARTHRSFLGDESGTRDGGNNRGAERTVAEHG
uniref:Uncharacterized protein n=1 Tax=Arundo donax TaxID=35708 RepID=A0A0A8YIJ7_ARUDO